MPLRVGIAGLGVAGSLHLDGYLADARAAVAAVADPSPARRATAPAGVRAYASATEMLEAETLDVVSICTPPDSHAALVMRAVEQGAAVLCEKPLARSAAEARPLVEAAAARGVLFGCALAHRFFPPTARLRELVAEGRLGRITGFCNRFAVAYTPGRFDWKWDPSLSGGGVLPDAATHAVDLFRFLVGEVAGVQGMVQHIDPGFAPVEDGAAMLLRSAEGAFGLVAVDWTTPIKRYSLEVYGTRGEAAVGFEPAALTLRLPGGTQTLDFPGETSTGRFRHLIRHFLGAAAGEHPLAVAGADGLRALEVVEEAG
jgi:predicted dehydrogenase